MDKVEYPHITFDLETLGRNTIAPIIQIGAVKFNEDGEIGDEFFANISWNSLKKWGFVLDYDTVKWWFEQDKAAIDSVILAKDGIDIKKALTNYGSWIGRKDAFKYEYWSHATFDAPIVSYAQSVCQIAGIIMPYKMQRDIRTLIRFSGETREDNVEGAEIRHNALHDARRQAKYISKAIRIVKYGKKYSYPKYMTDKLKLHDKISDEVVEEGK